jgi:hypothetical protein
MGDTPVMGARRGRDVVQLSGSTGMGRGRLFVRDFNTEEERGPQRAAEKQSMALRAKRLKISEHSAAKLPIPRTISVALCGSRSSSVLETGRRPSADSAGMSHP